MKKILSIIAIASIGLGSTAISLKNLSPTKILSGNYHNSLSLNYDSQKATSTNLSRIRINDFTTDLSVFDSIEPNKEDYLEEIKWGMLNANLDKEDILFEIWDSVLYDFPEKWKFSGLDLLVPEKGDEITVRIKITPIDLMLYTGTLSFRTTLVNELKNIENISNLFKNTIIGTVEDNSATTLRERIEQRNSLSNIRWNQIRFLNITDSEATLQAIDNSLYYKGSVIINFKVGKKLEEVIKVLNLGKIEEEINENLILKKVKEKNINTLINQISVLKINVKLGTAILVPTNEDGEYVGQVEVKFIDSKNISSVVKNTNLGYFNNPTRTDIIEKIVSLYPIVKRSDFTIDEKTLNYSGVNIIATSNSNYHGQILVNYNSNVTTGISYDSGTRRVDAYATTYKDIKTEYLYYYPEFSKEALLKKYSRVNYSASIYGWISSGHSVRDDNYSTSSKLDSNTASNQLYSLFYTNVNWMKAYSSVTYTWIGNKLEFKITTGAEAFASGWNTNWGRAEARTKILNIWFS